MKKWKDGRKEGMEESGRREDRHNERIEPLSLKII